MVEITDPITKEVWSYHMDKKLEVFLETRVKNLISKRDKDYVILIDGYEGSGKSTIGQQIGRYVDPTLSLARICMTASEFKQAILNAGKGQCVIYDEAVTGMTAGDSISRVGKLLKSLMMQMRQKNLLVIVILPTIFELNKYAVLSRARFFFHTYELRGKTGYWVGYNRKDMKKTYLKGKKTYSYFVRSRFNGRFYGKYTVDEQAYRKKKEDALTLIDDEDENVSEGGKMTIERRVLLCNLFENLTNVKKMSQDEFCTQILRLGIRMDRSNLSKMMVKTRKEGKIVSLGA